MARTRIINPDGLFPITEIVIEGPEDLEVLRSELKAIAESGGMLGEIRRHWEEARARLVANGLPSAGGTVRGDGGDVLEDASVLVDELATIGNWQELEGREDEILQRAFRAGMACQRMLVRDRERFVVSGARQFAGAKKGGTARARNKALSDEDILAIAAEASERAASAGISQTAAVNRVTKEWGIGTSTFRRRAKQLPGAQKKPCSPARH